MLAYRRLVLASFLLALVVIVVGAYVRLSDAGLGCPDWPGCYGHVGIPDSHEEIELANQAYPHMPVEKPKARKEMFHRYLAGALGFMILAIAVFAWRHRSTPGVQPRLATGLVAVVATQATLGMWTVTLLLRPAIVTAHLLGGMATLAILTMLAAPFVNLPRWPAHGSRLRFTARIALLVLLTQILLGGWVSTNYAALACPDLPLCRDQAIPEMDFKDSFHVLRELGRTAGGELLSLQALTAIHFTHRVGAIVVLALVLVFARSLWYEPTLRGWGAVLALLTLVQFSLGVTNVVFSLPLPVAVAHNGGAAVLLVCMVMINLAASRNERQHRADGRT